MSPGDRPPQPVDLRWSFLLDRRRLRLRHRHRGCCLPSHRRHASALAGMVGRADRTRARSSSSPPPPSPLWASLLAFLLTHYVAPEAAGSGVPEVEGALEGAARGALAAHSAGEVLRRCAGPVLGLGRRPRRPDHPHGRGHRRRPGGEASAQPARPAHAARRRCRRGPVGRLQRAARRRPVRDRGDAQAVPLHLPLLRGRHRRRRRQRLRHGAGRRHGAAASHRHRGHAARAAADLHGAGRRLGVLGVSSTASWSSPSTGGRRRSSVRPSSSP